MSVDVRRAGLFLAGVLAVAALPLVGRALRGDRADRCALDGVVLDPQVMTRLVESDGAARRFCCVDCAQRWLARTADRPRAIFVTDEPSGAEVAADEAWFVRSRVVAFAPSGTRVHVFARESDARRHAESHGGDVLRGDARPLVGRR
jgi:hypothetical protein